MEKYSIWGSKGSDHVWFLQNTVLCHVLVGGMSLCLYFVGNGQKDLDQQKSNSAKKDKPAAEPIVVPIVLRMSDFDHKVCCLPGL